MDLSPTAMTAGGAALARGDDGRVVFVEGALPGERVRARVVSAKKDFARAVTLEVLEASPHRVEAPCAARAAGCGGCSWQHVRAEAQGPLKVDIIADALRRIGRIDLARLGAPVTVRPLGVRPRRTTVRLGVDAAGRAGERASGTDRVVVADDCQAVHPRLEDLVVGGRFPGATEVVLRVGDASGERCARIAPDRAAIDAIVPDGVHVGADGIVHERVAGTWLQVSIGSFFQSGPEVAAALVAAVDDAIGSALGAGGHLVDAYAGIGLFGAIVGGRRGATVTAIEIGRSAVRDAAVNLATAGVDAVIVRSEVARWRMDPGRVPDVVVADPSRTGLGRPGVAAVVAAGAPRLVLVSCDPASLARDARLLADAGYRLGAIEVVDAFPDTFHVEAVTRFDRT